MATLFTLHLFINVHDVRHLYKDTYTYTCTLTQLQTDAQRPTHSTLNLSTHPQTPRHRCIHTHVPCKQHLQMSSRGTQAEASAQNVHTWKYLYPVYTYTYAFPGFHTGSNPNTDTQIFLHKPNLDTNLSRHTLAHTHTYTLTCMPHRTSSCSCHIYLHDC